MYVSEEKARLHCNEYDGYCTECDDVTDSNVEPDAEDYTCPECNCSSVIGFENAIMLGHVKIGKAPSILGCFT